MKNSIYDPETRKTYDYENEYELKIKLFLAENEYNFFDDEVIEYAIKIKSNIIDDLENNNSKSDKIRVKHIKWVENYIEGIHDFIIQHKIEIPKALENHKTFVYQTGKKTVGRPKGRSKQTDAKYHWVGERFYSLKKNKLAHTIEEHAKIIRSLLKTKKPDFGGDIYEIETIVDIIKKKNGETKIML